MLQSLHSHLLIKANTCDHIHLPNNAGNRRMQMPSEPLESSHYTITRKKHGTVKHVDVSSSAPILHKKKPRTQPTQPAHRETPKRVDANMSPHKCADPLFWCFLQIVDDAAETASVENPPDGVLKLQYLEKMEPGYKALRKPNALVAFSVLSQNLAFEKIISAGTMISLCAYKQLNVCILYSNSRYICETDSSDASDYYIVRVHPSGACSYSMVQSSELEKFTTNTILLDADKKNIKPISAYSSDILKYYATELGIPLINVDTGKQSTKIVLYEKIKTKLEQSL